MVSSSSTSPAFLLVLLVLPYGAVSAGHDPASSACYARLFSCGDSITDTGNFVSLFPNSSILGPPYGETFYGRPSGRFSDGRLIIDFIVEALRLPFSTPYLTGKTADDFRHGANFAMAGATALNQSLFKEMGLDVRGIPPYSLDVQLGWFKQVLQMFQGSTKQEGNKDLVSCSLLFLVGIGVNDYNNPLFQNRSFTAEIKPLVPKVVEKLGNAIKVFIGLGVKTIFVPGNIPMGCRPRYLAMFQSNNSGDYDADGCLKWLNNFAKFHNRALKRMLRKIPHDPTVTMIYGDYYHAIQEIIRNPIEHGFAKDGALTACCGDGGPYNSGSSFSCNATAILCPDPSKHVTWDGIHFTEATNKFVASGVLDGPYAAPSILSTCRR